MRFVVTLFFLAASSSVAIAANQSQKNSSDSSAAEEYIFDPELFRGGRFNQSALQRFTRKSAIAPGHYKIDLYVNSHFIDTYDVEFVAKDDNEVSLCLRPEIFQKASIRVPSNIAAAAKKSDECLFFNQIVNGGSEELNLAQLRLNLSVPHTGMNNLPRGYVNPDDLHTGNNLGFINYIGNYYHVSYSSNNSRNLDSAWLSLNGGINLGTWQYRQLSNVSWSRDGSTDWQNIRRYLQRPLPSIGSQFSMGELITSGRFFSGLNYNGFKLATDERMLPDSMRGFAPVIRGIASSNARVSVRQNGREIYQTTVAPGSFEITDLYPTSFNGDLDVQITETDGSTKNFSVPFSAIPESMRPGLSRYNIEVGRTRDSGNESLFGDLTWQRGMSNAITLNSGLRVADSYQAMMLGGVYGSRLGAMGLDLTWSRAHIEETDYMDGWMTHLVWSKTFQATDTTVSLASYRYSTSGFRDLSDVLALRNMDSGSNNWQSTTWRQRSRFDISLSQSLGTYGNLFLSGSTQNYRNTRSRDTQLQVAYSNSFRYGIGVNLSVARQRLGGYDYVGPTQTVMSLSFSVPLWQSGPRVPTLSNSWTRSSNGGDQYQSSLSGMLDEQQTTSYGINVSRDQHYKQTVVSGNMQKRFAKTTMGLNASRGNDYWQASGNAQGAVVLHSGGATFGPFLSETFALVEAKGAEGARVFNSQNLTIDDKGYALIPSITPYRYNRITLDPQNMSGNAELVDSEKRLAPVAGSSPKVVFRTRSGIAMLIKAHFAEDEMLPMGADVLDEAGNIIGMTGQGGQIYVRSETLKGQLTVIWGEDPADRCHLPFAVPASEAKKPMVQLSSRCSREQSRSK
jgi:outer membrane usher protein